jgi:hypothetical protein
MLQSTEIDVLVGRVLAGGDPEAQLQALHQLRAALDEVERRLACDAIRAGLSWRRIGSALGISKQAAHRRHRDGVARALAAPEPVATGGGERVGAAVRLSVPARRAIRLARQEAAVLGSAELGTEHLLLGVLRCGDNSAERLFQRLDIKLEAARRTLCVRGGRDGSARTDAAPVGSTVAASPLARRLVERALAGVAARRGGELTALDLLRALVSIESSGAARTLAMLGVAPERVRAELQALDQRQPGPRSLPRL